MLMRANSRPVAAGDLMIKSSSGSSKIEEHNGDLRVETASGGIRLISVEGVLICNTVSGTIRGEHVELLGDSSFSTASGTIALELVNDVDDLNFDLRSVSGSLQAGEHKGKRDLVIERGGLEIKGNSISGSQAYR